MNRLFLIITLFGFSFLFCSCSGSGAEKTAEVPPQKKIKTSDLTMHPEVKSKGKPGMMDGKGIAEAIKGKTLPDYPQMTIGKAFSDYFKKSEWRETFSKDKIYVDFIGWYEANTLSPENIKNGISVKGVEIKFVVTNEGSFYVAMVSTVEVRTDGKQYTSPLPNIKVVLDSIYAKKYITQ